MIDYVSETNDEADSGSGGSSKRTDSDSSGPPVSEGEVREVTVESVGDQLLNLREIANDSDTILIMVDPLEGFRSLADELDAEHIVVGGRQQINPLEIEETPQHVLERTSELNPYGQRVSSVMDFFTTYFGHIDSAGSEFGHLAHRTW